MQPALILSVLVQGGRSCVGLKLAYAEVKIALIHLYQHFTFELLPGQVCTPQPPIYAFFSS